MTNDKAPRDQAGVGDLAQDPAFNPPIAGRPFKKV